MLVFIKQALEETSMCMAAFCCGREACRRNHSGVCFDIHSCTCSHSIVSIGEQKICSSSGMSSSPTWSAVSFLIASLEDGT